MDEALMQYPPQSTLVEAMAIAYSNRDDDMGWTNLPHEEREAVLRRMDYAFKTLQALVMQWEDPGDPQPHDAPPSVPDTLDTPNPTVQSTATDAAPSTLDKDQLHA